MAWAAARARIKAVIALVTVTNPVLGTGTLAIKAVHEFPPATLHVSDCPCVILLPASRDDVERFGGARFTTVEQRLELIVADTDKDRAAQILEAFKDGIVAAFDADVKLNNTADVDTVGGPSFDEGGDIVYGQQFTGAEGRLTVRLMEAVTISA